MPGFLCRLRCFVLITFMIVEKIPDSCHQTLAVPLMSLIYPGRVSNSTLYTYASLSPAPKDSKNVTSMEMPVRTVKNINTHSCNALMEVSAHTCQERGLKCPGPRRNQGLETDTTLQACGKVRFYTRGKIRQFVRWLGGLGFLRLSFQGHHPCVPTFSSLRG